MKFAWQLTRKEFEEIVNPKPGELELVRKYVEKTGNKVNTEEDMKKVYKMFPKEWNHIKDMNNKKKQIYNSLPTEVKRHFKINELDVYTHKSFIVQALQDEKKVPLKVLQDYPELLKYAKENNLTEAEEKFKETQHWAFAPSELKSPETLNSDDKLVAMIGQKYGLIVLRNGTVTGKRTNGTDATQQEIFDAENETDLLHPNGERTEAWKDVYVDKNGKFIEFFEDSSLSTYKPVYVDDLWGNTYKYQGGGQFKKTNEAIIKQMKKIIREEVRNALREFSPAKRSH